MEVGRKKGWIEGKKTDKKKSKLNEEDRGTQTNTVENRADGQS